MYTLAFNCPLWPWPMRYGPWSRSLHIVSIRTFIQSYMVNHQCISKLKPRHEMSQTDIRTDERTDILTDEVYSYNPLQLYERGLKRISVYVNLKELPKSILRSNDLQGIPKQDVLWVERCAVLMTINQTWTVDRFTMLNIRNINITRLKAHWIRKDYVLKYLS